MSFSIETLQDFVVNIVNDEAAKAAYLADPAAALSAAGLADLSPADVQEVLPLIADSLPGGLPTDLSALPVDVPGLDALPVALPTGDLPALTGAPMDGLPGLGSLPVVGALPVGDLPVGDLPGLGGGLPSLPIDLPALPVAVPAVPGLPTDLPNLGDVTGNLPVDIPALPPLSAPVLGDIAGDVSDGSAHLGLAGDLIDSSTAGFLANPDNSDAPTISNSTETVLGDLDAGAKLDPQEFGGSADLGTGVADVNGGLIGHAGGDIGGWGSIETPAGDLAVGGLVSPEDGVQVAAQSPLGDLSLDLSADGSNLTITPGDPADLLDVQHLGDTGDAVVGTVAHTVAVTGGVLADGVTGGSDGLGGLLTGVSSTAVDTLDSTTGTVTDGIHTGTDTVVDHATTLPSVDGLSLPALPAVPDLPADLPQVTDVATSHLPVDLPDVSSVTAPVTDLVSNNPVTDVVHSSPVGGVVDGVTDHLHGVTDQLGDLHLGL